MIRIKNFGKIITFLFFIFLVIISQNVIAQSCSVPGPNDGINGPFDICGDGTTTKYAAYADIYIGGTEICYGTLNAVNLYVTNTAGSPNFSVKIYMLNTTLTTFTANATYSSFQSVATLVYSNASQGWLP